MGKAMRPIYRVAKYMPAFSVPMYWDKSADPAWSITMVITAISFKVKAFIMA